MRLMRQQAPAHTSTSTAEENYEPNKFQEETQNKLTWIIEELGVADILE